MKVLIFYKPVSEEARLVEEFIHDFGKEYPDLTLTVVNPDSVGGSTQAEIYDVMRYPTVLALSNDGSTLQRWDSGLMPLMNEVAYYANQ